MLTIRSYFRASVNEVATVQGQVVTAIKYTEVTEMNEQPLQQ